ncbi:MAG: NAD(P)/FAD-dependent oxidoreductase [Burkholderiaceae bacterium]
MIETHSGRPQVVIVGGGFGGLSAARGLAHAAVDITLVDCANHHTFQPLLYQVATAGLSAPQIASPIRHILRAQGNVRVLLDEAIAVDAAARQLQLSTMTLAYDYLVVATGVTHSYFGNDAWSDVAPGLKTLDDALEIRRRVLFAFESAERVDSEAERASWLTFVVIGAGPTGVELAGTLAEIARHTLKGEFRSFDPARSRVLLLEGGARVLPTYPDSLSQKALEQLAKLGVEVRVNARVTGIDEQGVDIGDERVDAHTVVWAAGVQATSFGRSLPGTHDRAGRVLVTNTLQIPDAESIYVVGDLAAVQQSGATVPGVAYAAKQMGAYAAVAIERAIGGASPPPPFVYRDRGSLATIGRNAAIALFPSGLRLSGWFAWWTWLLVHIFFLIGFRNRISTLVDWAWSYFTYQRHARLFLVGDRTQRPRQ